MKRLILHIGTHKTGTTAIQGFLKANAKLLEQDTGIFYPVYPKRYTITKPAHNGKFLHCQTFLRASGGKREYGDENGGSDWIWRKFLEQLKEHDTILLSDEQIWKCINDRKNYLASLHDIICESGIDQTDVVVYLRRQDEYLESYWKQWVKSEVHYTKSLVDHLRDQKKDIMRYLDYERGIRRIEETFGREHVIVRRYQRDIMTNGDVRYDFAETLGFTITDEYTLPEQVIDPRNPKGNVSLSNNLTEIMRSANLSPTYHDTNIRDAFFRNYRNAARAASLVSPESDQKASVLSPAQRDEILALFKEGNASIARTYFGLENGELFDPPERDLEHWIPDALSLQRDSTLFFTEVIAQMAAHMEEMEAHIASLEDKITKLESGNQSRPFAKLRKRQSRE